MSDYKPTMSLADIKTLIRSMALSDLSDTNMKMVGYPHLWNATDDVYGAMFESKGLLEDKRKKSYFDDPVQDLYDAASHGILDISRPGDILETQGLLDAPIRKTDMRKKKFTKQFS